NGLTRSGLHSGTAAQERGSKSGKRRDFAAHVRLIGEAAVERERAQRNVGPRQRVDRPPRPLGSAIGRWGGAEYVREAPAETPRMEPGILSPGGEADRRIRSEGFEKRVGPVVRL